MLPRGPGTVLREVKKGCKGTQGKHLNYWSKNKMANEGEIWDPRACTGVEESEQLLRLSLQTRLKPL